MRGPCPNRRPSFYLWVSTFSFHLSDGERIITGHYCLGDAWLRTETILFLSPGTVMFVIESSVSHLVYLSRMNTWSALYPHPGRWHRTLGLMFSSLMCLSCWINKRVRTTQLIWGANPFFSHLKESRTNVLALYICSVLYIEVAYRHHILGLVYVLIGF